MQWTCAASKASCRGEGPTGGGWRAGPKNIRGTVECLIVLAEGMRSASVRTGISCIHPMRTAPQSPEASTGFQ